MSQQSQSAVEVAELFADGLISDESRRDADAKLWWSEQGQHKPIRNWYARLTLEESHDLWEAAYASRSHNPRIKRRQVAILRDIINNPFRPVSIDPDWLSWNDGTVQKIAQVIYGERAFDRLPIMADALEEAGCNNVEILNHCRQPEEHVRGCWVVDALLGKS